MIRQLTVIATLLVLTQIGGCTMQRPVEHIRAQGDWLYERGEYESAAAEYEEITRRYPGDWRAQYRLGHSLLKLDRPAEARRSLEIAHTHRPRNDDIADALAEALFQLNEQERLYAFLRDRAESTQSVYAYRRLALYSLEMGDPDSARVAVETAIELDDGQSADPYLDAAIIAQEVGDVQRAVYRLRQAFGINPHDERVRQRLRTLGEVPGPTIALPPGRAIR